MNTHRSNHQLANRVFAGILGLVLACSAIIGQSAETAGVLIDVHHEAAAALPADQSETKQVLATLPDPVLFDNGVPQDSVSFFSGSYRNETLGVQQQVADDIVLPPTRGQWLITGMTWAGSNFEIAGGVFSLQPTVGIEIVFDLLFFADNGTGATPTGGPEDPVPGTAIARRQVAVTGYDIGLGADIAGYDAVFEPVALSGDTRYWVVAFARGDFTWPGTGDGTAWGAGGITGVGNTVQGGTGIGNFWAAYGNKQQSLTLRGLPADPVIFDNAISTDVVNFVSASFVGDGTGAQQQTADDFILPADSPNWSVTGMTWAGSRLQFVGGSLAILPTVGDEIEFDLLFFADDGSGTSPTGGPEDPVPGTAIAARRVTAVGQDIGRGTGFAGYDAVFEPVTLEGGTQYWVVPVARGGFTWLGTGDGDAWCAAGILGGGNAAQGGTNLTATWTNLANKQQRLILRGLPADPVAFDNGVSSVNFVSASYLGESTGSQWQIAEDFVLPAQAQPWFVSGASWAGSHIEFTSGGAGYLPAVKKVFEFDLMFFADDGTGAAPTGSPIDLPPGTAIASRRVTAIGHDKGQGDTVAVYDAVFEPVALAGGTQYWVVVSASGDFTWDGSGEGDAWAAGGVTGGGNAAQGGTNLSSTWFPTDNQQVLSLQAVDGAIFADGFGSGDLSAWSVSTPP